MKRSNCTIVTGILVFAVYLILPARVLSGGVHDSLLFDGADISTVKEAGDEYLCRISVDKVSGSVIGTRMIDKMVTECGGDPQKMVEYKKEKIQQGDFLKPGDEISAGPDGSATITLVDGKEIFIYPNTTFTVGRGYDYCKSEDIPVTVKKGGQLLIDARRGDRNKMLEIQTDRSKVFVKGTVFSVTTLDGGGNMDIVKTYEGTVEVYAGTKNGTETGNAAREIEKLNEDFQNKKITMDEYNAKMVELMSKIDKSIAELTKIQITLTAGNKCTIDENGAMTGPEAFDTGDDVNYKK